MLIISLSSVMPVWVTIRTMPAVLARFRPRYHPLWHVYITTSSNGYIFRVTGPLCGEFPCHRNSTHNGQWRGALMFSLICAWTKGWVNNRNAGDLRRHRAHHDVTVMYMSDVDVSYTTARPIKFPWTCYNHTLWDIYRDTNVYVSRGRHASTTIMCTCSHVELTYCVRGGGVLSGLVRHQLVVTYHRNPFH